MGTLEPQRSATSWGWHGLLISSAVLVLDRTDLAALASHTTGTVIILPRGRRTRTGEQMMHRTN
jgi:hypothetical protein